MFRIAKRTVRRLIGEKREIAIRWVKHNEDSWLRQHLKEDTVKPEETLYSRRIEQIATETNKLGPQPLWEGYCAGNHTGDHGQTRMADDVRTQSSMGDFYTFLVKKRRPQVVVEFGTAFGISGMYFLAGLEANQEGELFTFDPNKVWADVARGNLARIGNRFKLTTGTFENNVEKALSPDQGIDMAFIDAIHTSEFVIPQLDIVVKKSSPKALIILDDIDFSEDMKRCWQEVSVDSRFTASAALGDRVGILELQE